MTAEPNIWSNSCLPLLNMPVDCTFPQSAQVANVGAVASGPALEAFNARPVATRTRMTHDSQDHSAVPPFLFAPSGTTTVPAEIILQRELVETIVGKADALRKHRFAVDLSYKATFPSSVPDTIEAARHVTEETYSSAWSDIIDNECKKHPIECLMNDVGRMTHSEAARKTHLKHVEREIWDLYKLTMDLHPDTHVLIGKCRDTDTLQRALMNPVLQNAKKPLSVSPRGPIIKPKVLFTQPMKAKITFDR
jgi:hypothetical protein